MTPLSFLVCAVLSVLSTQAKVVEDFKECKRFFYKGTEPSGMDQNAVKICQKYQNRFYFATLYSPFHKIPLYSAYTFDRSNLENTGRCKRPSTWFIEPQLGGQDLSDEMSRESQFEQKKMKMNQATDLDYRSTGYDRGHLLPNCFMSTENRNATFTLTNAAPMYPDFNRVHWCNVERKLRKLLKEVLESQPNGKAYIITGAVPHAKDRMPKKDPALGNFAKVAVPTHVWTAVCFVDDSDTQNPFSISFGFIGENSSERIIKMYLLPQMNYELTFLYSKIGQTQSISVFADNCMSGDQNRLQQKSLRLIELQAEIVQKASQRGSHDWDGKLPSYSLFKTDELVECPYSDTTINKEKCYKDLPCGTYGQDYYWCYTESGTWDYCPPSLWNSRAKINRYCRADHPCGKYGESYDWCYTDSDNNWSECCTHDHCYSAINGKTCRSSSPCGYYGYDYLWCETTDGSWDYCCKDCEHIKVS